MDNETYTETRGLLVEAHRIIVALKKHESEYVSEDALTLKFVHMMLSIMLAAWHARYKED